MLVPLLSPAGTPLVPGPKGVAERRPLPAGRERGAVSLVRGAFGGGVGADEDGAVLGGSVGGFLTGRGLGGSGSRSIGVWVEGGMVVGGWETSVELARPVKGFGLGLYVGAGETGAEVTDGGGAKRDAWWVIPGMGGVGSIRLFIDGEALARLTSWWFGETGGWPGAWWLPPGSTVDPRTGSNIWPLEAGRGVAGTADWTLCGRGGVAWFGAGMVVEMAGCDTAGTFATRSVIFGCLRAVTPSAGWPESVFTRFLGF